MNIHAGFGFKYWRVAFVMQTTITSERLGFGGGIVIDPQGNHPNLFMNLMLAFLLITMTLHFCAHPLEEHTK